MSYGAGWGGSPWGDGEALVQSGSVLYDVVINDTVGLITDAIIGTYDAYANDTISITADVAVGQIDIVLSDVIVVTTDTVVGQIDVRANDTIALTSDVLVSQAQIPSILVGAQSPTKVEVVFSVAMSIDSNFVNPANYTITWAEGSVQIPVLSVEASGPIPLQRATLEIGVPLNSKQFYFLTVSQLVISLTGDFSDPDFAIFQWKDQTTPIFRASLEIPIRDFSGEVSDGLLGQPEGLVFFSPAFEEVAATSTIELEQISACTRAYDSYEMPNPPDPAPLFTWGPGNTSVIGPASVLWAPHDRLGLPKMNLRYDAHEDPFESAYDLNLTAVLVETIDITKGRGFMNDPRWKTFPGTGATVFMTAANQTSIGPGPTTPVHLDWPKIALHDSFPITDQVVLSVL